LGGRQGRERSALGKRFLHIPLLLLVMDDPEIVGFAGPQCRKHMALVALRRDGLFFLTSTWTYHCRSGAVADEVLR